MRNEFKAVVIGVSAGGLKALPVILGGLPAYFPLPVVIVQHRMASSDNYIIRYLGDRCSLTVKEAEEKEKMSAGNVYLAPAGYHLLIEKNTTFSLSLDDLVSFSRPSIDVLFESAAAAFGPKLIGVILTGANTDGKAGIHCIKSCGGMTIAQDPETAEVSIMPLAAISTKSVDFILTLDDIPLFLKEVLEGRNDVTR